MSRDLLETLLLMQSRLVYAQVRNMGKLIGQRKRMANGPRGVYQHLLPEVRLLYIYSGHMSRDCVMHIYIVAATLVATVLRTGAEAGLGGAAADLAQLGVRIRSRAAHSLRRARKRLLQIVFYSLFMPKTIVLPRQARDRHRKR